MPLEIEFSSSICTGTVACFQLPSMTAYFSEMTFTPLSRMVLSASVHWFIMCLSSLLEHLATTTGRNAGRERPRILCHANARGGLLLELGTGGQPDVRAMRPAPFCCPSSSPLSLSSLSLS